MIADLKQARLCIVGLGLMGGSLGMALRARRACHTVIGSARQPAACQQAAALGAVDEAAVNIEEAVRQADIVVLATPVRTIIQQVSTLGPLLKPGAMLIDLGSTKTAIVQAMAGLPEHVQAIGGHPMCGKEKAGIAAAVPDLYEGAVFCLTPLPRTRPDTLALAGTLARAVGARPLVIDAQRHDMLVAAVSHLPYLMACTLMATSGETANEDAMTWQLAASGLRDTSRLAGSSVDMMLDILLTNSTPVADHARRAAHTLSQLAAAIESADEATLRKLLTDVQKTWQQVYH